VARRNNADRLKPPKPDTTTPATNTTDDLFSFVSPTEFVALPSEGRFYPPTHPLHNVDTVEIRHMTAQEEDILTSEALLKKGVAINRMIDSVLVDKSIRVNDLLLGDKNAILIAARISGFGPLYEVDTTCPACKESATTVFNLEEMKPTVLPKKPKGITLLDNGHFATTLPKSQVTVTLRLLTTGDEERLMKNTEMKKKVKKIPSGLTDLLKTIIVSANDHTDRATLEKFVEMMPLPDVSYLRKRYEQVKPDMDVKFDFECPACDHVGKVVMPMTANFFWPDR